MNDNHKRIIFPIMICIAALAILPVFQNCGGDKSGTQGSTNPDCNTTNTCTNSSTCTNGALDYPTCTTFAECADGQSENRTKFEAPLVEFGQDCQTETQSRICTNSFWESWSGTYTSDNCIVAANPDEDTDGILNAVDNCPLVANADQHDLDSNGIGDFCDTNFTTQVYSIIN